MNGRLIDIITTIFEVFSLMLYSNNCIKIRVSKAKIFATMLSIIALMQVSVYFLPPQISTLATFLLILLIPMLIFKIKFSKMILNILIIYIIIIPCNALGFVAVRTLFGSVTLEFIQKDFILNLVLATPELIALVLFIMFNKQFIVLFNHIVASQKTNIYFLITFQLGVFLTSLTIENAHYTACVIGVYLLAFLIAIFQLKKYVNIEIKDQLIRQHNQALAYIRACKHEDSHSLSLAYTCLEMGNVEEAKKMLQHRVEKLEEFNFSEVLKDVNPNILLGFNQLIFQKLEVVFEENIDLKEVKLDYMNLHSAFNLITDKLLEHDIKLVKITTMDYVDEVLFKVNVIFDGGVKDIDLTEIQAELDLMHGRIKYKKKLKTHEGVLSVFVPKKFENEEDEFDL